MRHKDHSESKGGAALVGERPSVCCVEVAQGCDAVGDGGDVVPEVGVMLVEMVVAMVVVLAVLVVVVMMMQMVAEACLSSKPASNHNAHSWSEEQQVWVMLGLGFGFCGLECGV